MSTIPTEEADPQSTMTSAGTPEEQVTVRAVREPAAERRAPKFLSWEKVLHPSQPVMAASQIPWPSRGPRLRLCDWEERMVQVPQTESLKMVTTLQETLLPTQELEVICWAAPTPGFLGVMACLRRDEKTGRDPQKIPKPSCSRSDVGPWGGDYEYKLHC